MARHDGIVPSAFALCRLQANDAQIGNAPEAPIRQAWERIRLVDDRRNAEASRGENRSRADVSAKARNERRIRAHEHLARLPKGPVGRPICAQTLRTARNAVQLTAGDATERKSVPRHDRRFGTVAVADENGISRTGTRAVRFRNRNHRQNVARRVSADKDDGLRLHRCRMMEIAACPVAVLQRNPT
jgi:hypothetical protein